MSLPVTSFGIFTFAPRLARTIDFKKTEQNSNLSDARPNYLGLTLDATFRPIGEIAHGVLAANDGSSCATKREGVP
jgi:hypothetical protein